MPNVQISDLPDAIIPMDLTGTFFEVQTVESGVQVSRKVSGDQLTFTSGFEVEGTSLDDPAIGGGVFNGTLDWQNANNERTGVLGFEPAGDEFVIQNLAEGGEISLRVRDGTIHLLTADYGVTIPTTGAIRVPVGTTAEEPAALDGQIRYDSDNNVFRGVVSGSWEDLGGGASLPTGSIGQTIVNNDGAEGYAATSGVFVDVNGIVRLENDAAGGGTTQLDVISTGLILRDTVTASPNNLFIRFIEDSGFPVTLANLGFVASDTFTLDGLAQLVTINSNQSVSILVSGVAKFQTLGTGFKALGTLIEVDNDGSDTLTRMRVRNLTGGVEMRVLVGGDGAISQLVGTSGSFEGDFLQFARDLGVTILHNDVDMARSVAIGSGGFEVNNTVTGGGFERVLTTADISGVSFPLDALDNEQIRFGTSQDALFFFDGTDMQINMIDTVDLRVLGGTAGAETMLSLIANGAVEASFNGDVALATQALGVSVIEPGSTGPALQFLDGPGGTLIGNVRANLTGFVIDNRRTSGPISLRGVNAAVSVVDCIACDPDGAVDISHDNVVTISTLSNGATVVGSTLDLNNSGLGGAADIQLRNSEGGGLLRTDAAALDIIQIDSAGAVQDTWITMVQNGRVGLLNNNTEMARTATIGNGGFEVNNTVTGAGFERVLTTSDLVGSFVTDIRTGNLTLADTVQATALSVTLLANSRYAVEAIIIVLVNAADDFDWRFVEPAAGWDGNGLDVWTGDDNIGSWTEDTELTRLTSGGVDVLHIKGEFTTDGTAGSLELQGAKNLDTGADGTLFNGSWLRAQLMT